MTPDHAAFEAAETPRISDEEVACIIRHEKDPPDGRGSIIPALAMDLRDARAQRDVLRDASALNDAEWRKENDMLRRAISERGTK